MRLKLISCDVLFREMCHVVSRSSNIVDIQFLPKGLHDMGAKGMKARLQAVLDSVEEEHYDAIILGYGLCNNGLNGLVARSIPLVVARAHDCITLFLGSKERYLSYFEANPGVYFKTTGWIERSANPDDLQQLSIQHQTGMDSSFDDLVAKYGEENAQYLWETLCDYEHNYHQFTFIEMGVEPNDSYERHVREDAAKRGWEFSSVKGDLSLFQRLVDGQWDDKDFLVIPPGHKLVAVYDENIIRAEKVEE